MKKLRLFMGALALCGASSAFAQESGEYYLYEPTTGHFLSRGDSWGSRSVTDQYGLLFTWDKAEGTITFKDSGLRLFVTNDRQIFTDNTSNSTGWKFTEVEGGYTLQYADDSYIGYPDASSYNVNFVDSKEKAIVWQFLGRDQRDKIVQNYEMLNYDNIIAKAGLSTTSADFLNTINSDTYAQKDLTDKMETATFNGNKGAWTWNQVRSQGGQPAYGTNFCEVWQATGSFTQTVSGLPEGIYKVTMKGFERNGGYASCTTLGDAGYELSTATLEANGAATLLASWYSGQTGGKDPNNTSQAVAKFNEGKYDNTVYTYVGADGTMDLKVNIPSFVGDRWVIFNDFKLTLYTDQVSTEDAAALLAAVPTGKMEKKVAEELAAAKAAFEANKSIANYNALQVAVNKAKPSAEAYAAALPAIEDAKALLANNISTADAKKVFEEAIAKYESGYNEGTLTTAEAANAGADLGVIVTGWRGGANAAAPIFMASAWDFTSDNWEGPFYVNTWSVEGETDGTGFLVPFIEAFKNSGTGIEDCVATATVRGADIDANQTKAVKIWSRFEKLDKNAEVPAGAVTLQVGEGTPVDLTKCLLNEKSNLYVGEFEAAGKADADANLVIKVTIKGNSNLKWVSFKNAQYGTYVPKETTNTLNFNTSELEEADITEEKTFDVGDVKLTVTPSYARSTSTIHKTSNGPQLRTYGGYLKLQAPEGKSIKSVSMNTAKWAATNYFNGELAADANWTGDDTNVYLAVGANTQINSITVVTSDITDATTTYTVQVNNFESVKKLPGNSEFALQMIGTKVTLANENANYCLLEDQTGAVKADSKIAKLAGMTESYMLDGTLYGTLTRDNNGLVLLKGNSNTAQSSVSGEEIELEPAEKTVADLNKDLAYKFISLSDLTIEKVTDEYGNRDYYLVNGESKIMLNDNFGLLSDPMTNRIRNYESIANVTGFVTMSYWGDLTFMPYGKVDGTVAPLAKIENIAALKQQESLTDVELTLTDAKVTIYMPSMWDMYPTVFLEDATGAVYLNGELAQDILGITGANTVLNGTLFCTYQSEWGQKSIMPNGYSKDSKVTLKEEEVLPTERTIAELADGSHELEYVKVSGVELSIDTETWELSMTKGEETMKVYNMYEVISVAYDEEYVPSLSYGEIDYMVGYTIPYDEGIYAFIPLQLVEKETPTAINGINAENAVEGDLYNMSGVKVRKAGQSLNGLKGIYILNGKKVVLK